MALYTRVFLSILSASALLATLDFLEMGSQGEALPRIAWFWIQVSILVLAVTSVVSAFAWLGIRLHGWATFVLPGKRPSWLRRTLDLGLWAVLWTGVSVPLLLLLARDVQSRPGFLRNPWSEALTPLVFPALLLITLASFATVRAVGVERGPVGRTRLGLADWILALFVAGCLVVDANYLVRYYALYHAILAMMAFVGTALFTVRRLGDFGLQGSAVSPVSTVLHRATLSAAVLSVAVVLAGPILQWPPHAEAAMFHTTHVRRVASWLHETSDWDQDGFARLFGGGDPDDRDPTVHPLAVDEPEDGIDQDGDGRDRTHAEDRELRGRLARRTELEYGAYRAKRVLLVTIDALRSDRLESKTSTGWLLPRLRALASEGVNFTHAYSPTAGTISTFRSVLSSSSANRDSTASFLPSIRGLGTHTYFIAPDLMIDFLIPLRAQMNSFDVSVATFSKVAGLDLLQWGVHLEEPTAGATTDSIVSVFRTHGKGAAFVWAHYYDSHQWHDLDAVGDVGAGTDQERYDAVLRLVEAELSRLLDELEALGSLRETAIIITGDHGEGLGDHGLRFHGHYVWESVTRVPLIMVIPGVGPRTIATPVSLVDLGPTIVTLLGGEWTSPPSASLLHLLDREPEVDDPVFLTELTQVGVVLGRWKLVFGKDDHRFRLFNLADDPGETRNLSGREESKFAELRVLLALHVEESSFSPGSFADDN